MVLPSSELGAPSQPSIVIGVDPGLGVKSPLGIAVFSPTTREIKQCVNLRPLSTGRKVDLRIKLKELRDLFTATLQGATCQVQPENIILYIESFVMRGKSGQSLQRLIGTLLSCTSDTIGEVVEVSNTVVKRFVGTHGKCGKEAVGKGVLEYFNDNPKSRKIVKRLIREQEWDILDALAIAITGLLVEEGL